MTRLALLLLILLSSWCSLGAQTLSLTDAFPNLTFHQPLFLTHSGDHSNRIFVVRQDGIIHVFPNDSSVISAGVFLDLSAKLSAATGEEGLLGLAFPPDFRTSRVFYVDYTAPSSIAPSGMKVVIARFAVSPLDSNKADSSSEKRLLEIEEPAHNHNGGMLAFGPDSNLYIGVGDGGDANDPFNNGQTLSTLLGKILRIDVRGDSGYAIPRDNPFARDSAGVRKEIWAYGLRNPWRFSFDSATGQLWAGDVGQDTREEVDIITRGGNYGWRIMEGTICRPGGGGNCDTTGLIMPVADYGRHLGSSITGGYVYHGSRVPQLAGAYIFGDFGWGNIFLLRYEGGKITADSVLLRNDSFNISSFGVDEKNELYVLGYNTGKVMRLTERAGPTSVAGAEVPLQYSLGQNYPNPFNPTTRIKYTVGGGGGAGAGGLGLGTSNTGAGSGPSGRDSRSGGPENQGPGASKTSLVVYDLLGREVAVLVNEKKAPGSYEVQFDGSRLASGVYVYRLTAGSFVQSRIMVLLK
jgi:glucose/arabinose dehydrogenase